MIKSLEKYLKLDLTYFLKNGFLAFSSQMVTYLGGAVVSIVLSRVLSQETYGKYAFLLAIFSMCAIFALPGMTTALYQASSKNEAGLYGKAFKKKVQFSLLGTLLLLSLALYNYYQKGDLLLAEGFFVLALFLPLYYSGTLWKGLLEGKRQFKKSLSFNILTVLLSTSAVLIAAIFSGALLPLLLSYTLTYTFLNLFFFFLSKKEAEGQKKDAEVLAYGIFLTKMSLLGSVAVYVDRLILGFMIPAETFSVYAISLIIPEALFSLLKSTALISTPKLVEHDYEQSLKKLLETFWFLALLLILLIIAAVLLSPFVIELVFTEKYAASIPLTQIILLSLFFYFFEGVLFNLLTVFKKKRALKVATIHIPILRMVLTIFCFATFGFMGVVWSQVFSRMLGSGSYLYLALKEREIIVDNPNPTN